MDPSAGRLLAAVLIPMTAIAVMVLEHRYWRRRGIAAYHRGETIATAVIALGHRFVAVLGAPLALWPLHLAYQHRWFDMPMEHPATVPGVVLAVEFCYYWHHRAMHRVQWFWASHQVHHSARHFNLSAAVRLGWGANLLGGVLFYLPLAVFGVPPQAILATLAVGLLYQFALHTAGAPRLGPLEWVLNTPTHHRVHHAANTRCLDRNFGAMLIIYDRMFGTFASAPDDEALRFGLRGVDTQPDKPLAVMLAGWVEIGRRLRRATSPRAVWFAVFGRP